MEESPLLDDYVLACSPRKPPRICFLATASGDAAEYVERFFRAFEGRACIASHLTLADLPERIADHDIIYVGGGNTAHMLEAWRTHGFDVALRAASLRGVVMAGLSAGMNCWFETSVTDSFGPLGPLADGLGLIAGSACPHYDSEAARRPTYRALVGRGLAPGYAADDGVALHFVDEILRSVVSSRKLACAYRVERTGETVLPARYLGDPDPRGHPTE